MSSCIGLLAQERRHRVDWGGHIHPTLPEGAEIAEDAVSSWG